jgi:uncharacterized protein
VAYDQREAGAMPTLLNEEISRAECLELLREARVGRLGISIDALPAVLPVNYLLLSDAVVIRMVGDSALFRASSGAVVAFEVDDYDSIGSFGWSVLVRGIAAEITDADELELAGKLWLDTWPLGELADRFLALPISMVSGRRFLRVR